MMKGALSSPYLLGFEDIEHLVDRLTKNGSDGYPPYNIEKLSGDEPDTMRLRITLAVAGFSDADLDITLEENQLVIAGKQTDDPGKIYLHRGIAARQFQRTFVLADGIEVEGAHLADGLLSVDLRRNEPERLVKSINISTR
ncbi:MAG: Hsp20 family protein [Pseudomonadota bacterium]